MCTLLPPCPPNRYILFCFITCSSFVVYLEDRKNLSIADTNSGWETAISSLGMDVEQFFFAEVTQSQSCNVFSLHMFTFVSKAIHSPTNALTHGPDNKTCFAHFAVFENTQALFLPLAFTHI